MFKFPRHGHEHQPAPSTRDLFGSHFALSTNLEESALLTIDDLDFEVIYHLRVYIGHDNTSFPRFLDDSLWDMLSDMFDEDISLNNLALQSINRLRGHLRFHCHHVMSCRPRWN